MPWMMTKKATPADRSRKRVSTASEAMVPSFSGDSVSVVAQKASTVRALERAGWKLSEPAEVKAAPAPAKSPSSPAAALDGLTVKELREMAKGLQIKGRSRMTEAELISAITAAEA